MAHIEDNPSRAKRRKLDEGSQTHPEPSITNPHQLRDLLLFQQNAVTAKQGESLFQTSQVSKLTGDDRNHQVQRVLAVNPAY